LASATALAESAADGHAEHAHIEHDDREGVVENQTQCFLSGSRGDQVLTQRFQ